MEILREKIKADKKLVVAANMDMTDAEIPEGITRDQGCPVLPDWKQDSGRCAVWPGRQHSISGIELMTYEPGSDQLKWVYFQAVYKAVKVLY